MIATLIIFLPTLIAMGLMIQFHVRKKRWVPLLCFPYLVFVVIFQCLVLTCEFRGQEVLPWINDMRNMLICLALPAGYIILCSKSGTKWLNLETVVMSSLTLSCLTGGFSLSLDSVKYAPQPADNWVYFISNGKVFLSLRIIELVMLIQAFWIITWGAKFRLRMKKEKMHVNKKSKTFIYFICSTIGITVVSLIIPNELWAKYHILYYIYFILLSISLTAMEVLVSWGYMLTPFLDDNNEPAVNTVSVNFEMLKKNLRKTIEEDRLYLNPNLKISDIALQVGTNRTYISKAINEMAGCNFNTYLNSLRIKEAEHMINNDKNVNLEYVAMKCGFNTASAFTKVFKKEKGYNPSELKKEITE